VDSAFDSCLKDTGSNPAEADHCVTITVGKLFTPTVPGAEGRLNQLTPGAAGTSVATRSGQVVYMSRLRSTQPFILNWLINRIPGVTTARVKAEDAASGGWQVTLCDPPWDAGSRSGAGASSTN